MFNLWSNVVKIFSEKKKDIHSMPFASYIKLVKSQPKLLSFGFLMAFASCPGETYFIGVFGPAIQNDLNLDHTQWGSIYMVGTLASMALLPWTGGLIDRFSLTRYTIAVSVLLDLFKRFTRCISKNLIQFVTEFFHLFSLDIDIYCGSHHTAGN